MLTTIFPIPIVFAGSTIRIIILTIHIGILALVGDGILTTLILMVIIIGIRGILIHFIIPITEAGTVITDGIPHILHGIHITIMAGLIMEIGPILVITGIIMMERGVRGDLMWPIATAELPDQ